MKKSTLVTITLLVLTLVVVGYLTWLSAADQQTNGQQGGSEVAVALQTSNEQAPYTTLDGQSFQLESLLGSVLVVNSWASWCPFCMTELPDFNTLATNFAADNVIVVAINRKEPTGRVKSYLDTLGPLPNLLMLLDPADRFYTSIGGFGMPETVFYDTTGAQVFHKRGIMTYEEMEKIIQDILAKT